LIKISILPKRFTVSSTSAFTWRSSLQSAVMATALPPF
jgi:hypothetical protein